MIDLEIISRLTDDENIKSFLSFLTCFSTFLIQKLIAATPETQTRIKFVLTSSYYTL